MRGCPGGCQQNVDGLHSPSLTNLQKSIHIQEILSVDHVLQ